MARVKFLRNTSVAGRSFAAGDEIDLNDADTHAVVSIGRATYVNREDDPKLTSEPAPNPSVIPDLQRSLDPKIRQVVAQGMETAIREHEEEMRNPTVPDGIVRDAEGNPIYPEGDVRHDPNNPQTHDADLAARAAEDRLRDPGNIHVDPQQGPARAPSAAPRGTPESQISRQTGTSSASRVGHEATRPAPAGSAEAAVKHQTSSSSASGSHPRK